MLRVIHHGPTRLCVADREEISRLHAADAEVSWTVIGHCIDRHRSTIQREVACNGGPAYRWDRPGSGGSEAAPVGATLLATSDLAQRIAVRLRKGYSPAGTVRLVGVCAEAIYEGVYAGTLEVKASAVLRSRPPPPSPGDARDHRAPVALLGRLCLHPRPARGD